MSLCQNAKYGPKTKFLLKIANLYLTIKQKIVLLRNSFGKMDILAQRQFFNLVRKQKVIFCTTQKLLDFLLLHHNMQDFH